MLPPRTPKPMQYIVYTSYLYIYIYRSCDSMYAVYSTSYIVQGTQYIASYNVHSLQYVLYNTLWY